MANLIAYYSRKGENYFSGTIKSVAKGNTEIVAEAIQKKLAAICSRLKPKKIIPQITLNALSLRKKS